MKNNILVIGGGLVGGFVYETLKNEGHSVHLCDIKGNTKYSTHIADCTNQKQLNWLIVSNSIDLIINCSSSTVGHQILKNCILNEVDCIDITFGVENPVELELLAHKHGVTCLVDVGLAPGMPGIFLGHYNKIEGLVGMVTEVGGVPAVARPPYYYKAAFSPRDVIEEYIRPARYILNKEVKSVDPIKNYQCSYFGQEYIAFVNDGLRTLLYTKLNIDMIEITTRHREHWEEMNKLHQEGAFKKENIDATAKILTQAWAYKEGEPDKTLFRIEMRTKKNQIIIHEMKDLATEEHSSMSRTTGLVATGLANFLLACPDSFESGVYCPDHVGEVDGTLQHLLKYMKNYGVNYRRIK